MPASDSWTRSRASPTPSTSARSSPGSSSPASRSGRRRTAARLAIGRKADAIVQEEVANAGLRETLWQAFAVLLPVKSVGVMGDERTYESACVLRAVESLGGMTADWARHPWDLVARISSRITNEVRGINRVVLDVSSKPPATIEWE